MYIAYISVLVFLPKGNKLCYSITFSQQNLKINNFVVVVVVVVGVVVGASVGVFCFGVVLVLPYFVDNKKKK